MVALIVASSTIYMGFHETSVLLSIGTAKNMFFHLKYKISSGNSDRVEMGLI